MKKQLFNKRISYRFKRFLNKRYAAFRSLHREVTIGKVSAHVSDMKMLKAGRAIAACCMCAVSIGISAADDEMSVPLSSAEQLTLQEVMVVAQKAELQNENLRVINRISAEQLRGLPQVSISDLLDYLPGIDARARGANGTQTDISIRGGSFDQVIVMLNSQNMTDPQTGHYTLDLPIDPAIIDHIDVLTGTGMSQFGLSAFSGAINIVTKKAVGGTLSKEKRNRKEILKQVQDEGEEQDEKKKGMILRVEGGDYGLFHPSWLGSISREKASVVASAQYNQSTGYTDNTDYKIGDLFLQSSVNGKSGEWNMQAGAQYKGVGANSFYSLNYPDQFDATKMGFAGLDWTYHLQRFTLHSNISYKAHHDRFELYRETWKPVTPASWYTNHNYHLTQTATANLSAQWASKIGTTTVGIELRNENILSNVLGDARPNPGTSIFTYQKNRLNINYFAQQTIYWRGLSVGVGLSGNWNTMFSNNMAWGVNIGYELPQQVTLYANANQGVRLPTFTDLYYKSATQLANPDLKPEKAITTELGIKWHNEHFMVQGAGYYRWGRDIIDWVLLPGDTRWQSRNLTAVNAVGGEAQVAYHLNEWLQRVSLSYSYCQLDKRAEGFQSKYALDYMRHKLVFQMQHGIWKGLGASWTLSWQQREGEYTNRDGVVETYRPVVLFDGRLFYRYRWLTAAIDATNIIGTKYYDYGGILQPERWVKASIEVEL